MDLLMDFGAWLIQTLFWVVVWYIVIEFVMSLIRRRMLGSKSRDQELKKVLDDLENEQLIPLLIEVEGNTYLCYNCLTNDFVCQGQNIEEILARFKQRYPGRYCSLSQGQPEVLDLLKKQLKEYHENLNRVGSPS